MGDKSKIGWTDATWGPVTGCDKISPGCLSCYACTLAEKFRFRGVAAYQKDGDPLTSGPGFGVTLHLDRLDMPLRWKRPRMVFVNSMSDAWHKEVSDDFIIHIFAVMATTPRHTYQVLTKRSQRMQKFMSDDGLAGRVYEKMDQIINYEDHPLVYPAWPLPNVWLGVSVENQRYADLRIPHLLDTPAAVRFLSCEPLLGSINLSAWLPILPPDAESNHWWPEPWLHPNEHPALSWILVGGESGNGFRPMGVEWAESLVNQCKAANVSCFVKQDSGRYPGKQGRLSDEMWAIKEFPS